MRRLISFLLILFSVSSFSTVINVETDTFQTIDKVYHDKVSSTDNALLVFDIDDTLLTMTQSLGSVGWWDWQYDLLKHDSGSSLLFAHSTTELLKVQNILFKLIKMDITDPDVLPFIKTASQNGGTLLGLTARGPEHENVTESELQSNGFVEADDFLFTKEGIKLFHQKTSSSGELTCQQLARSVTYVHGIMYLAGQDKGEALRCVLNDAKKHYNKILFVDDTLKNHVSMEKAFKDDANSEVINVLYTREHLKEQAFLHSTEQQKQTYDHWMNIKTALHANIKEPEF